MAIVRYQIILSPEAVRQLRGLRADVRATVRDSLDRYPRCRPTRESRSRIKRLRGMSKPQYRLRVDDVRVHYDVDRDMVAVLAIVRKSEADAWLGEIGEVE